MYKDNITDTERQIQEERVSESERKREKEYNGVY